ncbi:putative TIM-barrel fold metal-dependent hydrolase [Streptomyces griseochromogenes]|uniref:Metal-dependent hydrolase n=1 Tax=Streptomyces griseochromogenes TaxID=68214 RepID=A0A1B1B9Z6_9ACTN|nr:amidohydrolase family protein [Streptomyces griseochromogenes]ANP55646.1 metal-dependent hydrolase [Streptomyces griseochromogenes]MBP2052734.1 putative TIM-barrel fold metal-dependent hydrolase [Streptomyces griseochromogenes]
MIIDAHSHVHDPVEDHLALLDDAGVDRAVLFGTRPHPERATDLESLRREMAVLDEAIGGRAGGVDGYRAAWRELDEALGAHPDRFIGFRSVPLDLAPHQVAEVVDRDVVGCGLRGIGELTPPPGRADLVEPVMRAASDHGGLPVVVHGFAPTTAEDLRTLARLAGAYPSVPLVISQLGGLHWMDAIELVRDTPSMFLELSTANVIFAVRLAVKEIPDRTLFGSDAPYGDPALARATVERVTGPGEVRDQVLGGTAARLLGLA